MNKETRIDIISIVVDNSNQDYQNAIVLVYWKLVSWCPDEICNIQTSYATYLTPSYDNNFVPIENVNPELLATWIQNTYGPNYDTLVQRNLEKMSSEFESLRGENVVGLFFNTRTKIDI